MEFRTKYGPVALVAGASEGLGAAFAQGLAARGLDLVLIARTKNALEQTADRLIRQYKIRVRTIVCDLADPQATQAIGEATSDLEIGFLVYNAAASHIGPFLSTDADQQVLLSAVNIQTQIKMVHHFGGRMVANRRGGVIMMSSLAGFQGSGFLSTYAATKAFSRVLAEGLWFEWKTKGVDVMACCAGATATPNYLNTNPRKVTSLAPRPQTPEQVVASCLKKIGKTPSFTSGRANRWVSFLMKYIFTRKQAINLMGNTARKMYDIKD